MQLLQSVSNSSIPSSRPCQICQVLTSAHMLCLHTADWPGTSQILPGRYVTTLACATTTLPPGVTYFKHRAVLNTALSLEVEGAHAYTIHTAHLNMRTVTRRCNYRLVDKYTRVLAQRILCENMPSRYHYWIWPPNSSIRCTLEFWALGARLHA